MKHGTERREPGELDSLYAAGAEVEPDRGLDRRILARAQQSVARPATKRPAPWLGGLATAAALVLVIAVVVDPGTEAPDGLPAESLAPAPPVAEPSPAPVPSSPARSGGQAELNRQSLRSRQEQAVAPAMSDEFAESAGRTRIAEAEVGADESAGALHRQAEALDDAALLEWIARLIEQGELDQAAELSRLLEARQAGGEEP